MQPGSGEPGHLESADSPAPSSFDFWRSLAFIFERFRLLVLGWKKSSVFLNKIASERSYCSSV
jgi:hypothetical protein